MVAQKPPAAALKSLLEGVTSKWAKQRRAEERHATARLRRNDRMFRCRRVTLREAAYDVLQKAFEAASANGTLPANARQIYYAARPGILACTGKDSLDSQYFCQTILIDYMQETGVDWDVVWDDRGHFTEPHGGKVFGLGTLNVRNYLNGNCPPVLGEAGFKDAGIGTHGPDGRFGAILFIEKEGFAPIFEAAHVAEKFDIAIMSSKGMSVTAARTLVDRICTKYRIPLLTLHDFDIAGFSIGKTIGSDTRRYSFRNQPRVIDLGLRLTDVESLGLETEDVSLGNVDPSKIRARLRLNGATEAETSFLLGGERVELNAMTSDQLVTFVEDKLTEHGIAKVVPGKDALDKAFRLFARGKLIKTVVEEAIEGLSDDQVDVPDDLEARVKNYLVENPSDQWISAIRQEAEDATSAGLVREGSR